MEKGIYDDNARFFAPYYSQADLNVYTLPVADRAQYLEIAYEDVSDAFEYYMEHYNEGLATNTNDSVDTRGKE